MSCRILSTRKLLPEVVEQARQKNIEVHEVEFISVKSIDSKEKLKEINYLLQGNSPLVFTSANAVEAIVKHLYTEKNRTLPSWKIYTLSGRTREWIENSDVLKDKISITGKNAAELAEKIIRHQEKEVIFFCGDKRRDELPEILAAENIRVHECVVYETIETPSFIPVSYDGILFFSPSAVKSFFSVNQLHVDVVCFAIGETTGTAIKEFTINPVIISKESSQENMMHSVFNYCWKE